MYPSCREADVEGVDSIRRRLIQKLGSRIRKDRMVSGYLTKDAL